MSLEHYHSTTYSHCLSESSYFLTTTYLTTTLSIIAVFSIPFSMYGVYCILWITPKQMSSAKWALFNVHFWTIALDFVLNVLSIPMVFLPSYSGIMLGLGSHIGMSHPLLQYLIKAILGIFYSAVIGLFENRQNVMLTKWKIKRIWARVLLNSFNYLVAVLLILPPYLMTHDVYKIKLEILELIPCPVETFFDSATFALTDHPQIITTIILIQSVIFVPQTTFFIAHNVYYLVFAHNSQVSMNTRRMQWKFLRATFSQIAIPTLILVPPVFYIVFSMNTEYYNQELNNHTVVWMSTHGLMSTGCMVFTHQPYREHFIKCVTFGRVPDKKNSIRMAIPVTSLNQIN
uniref:Serpentine Receptor, class H n=1 Tax=Caenorhabditis japonica TaxID=281687 RepID=A0A8R1HL38_CAEJA